jgi:hypothetical protein
MARDWRLRPALLPCLVFGLAVIVASGMAQTAATGAAADYRIAGHVVSATDGRPLQRARVQLLQPRTNKAVASAVAGDAGEFEFGGVKGGAYVLEGKAPGYLASRYDAHGQYSTAIVTGAGVDTESLALKLTPEAMLSGRVTDEAGDPVRRANVTLYREDRMTGEKRIVRAGGTQTDDAGGYELAHLGAGTYYVAASARPWYAVYAQAPRQTGEPVGVVDAVDPALNVAYARTFYPEATESSGAAPIALKGGEEKEIDIRFSPQVAATITVPVAMEKSVGAQGGKDIAPDGFRGGPRPQIQLQKQVFDELDGVNGGEMRASATSYTFVGLAPGQYVVKQTAQQTGEATRSAKVNLSQYGEQVDLAKGDALGSVKVVLKTVDGGKLLQTSLALAQKDAKQSNYQTVDDKGEAEVHGVEAGEYYFVLSHGNENYFVTRLESDGKTLPGNRLVVSAAAKLAVTVTASAANGTLQGFARSGGKPAAGAMVILVAADEFNRGRFTWRDQSDLDGSFNLSNIPPGRYTLLAIEDGWDLEWQREEVLAHYLPLGVAVVIPGGGGAAVKVRDAVAVQPR